MAGYSTINAQFRPMSYQEMLAPVVAADTEHKAIEEQEAQLQALSTQWANKIANEAPDSKVRTQYQRYLDDLNKATDALSVNGLNSTSRKLLAGLKARYASDIVPIEEAYKLKQQKVAEDNQLKKQDYILNRDMSQVSLDEYMNNPFIDNESYSGAMISKRVADTVRPIAEKFAGSTTLKHKNPQYYEYMQRYGATQGTIMALKQGIVQGEIGKQLQDALNGVINSTGISNWKNRDGSQNIDAFNKALEYGYEGLGAAVGKDVADLKTDQVYMYNLEHPKVPELPALPLIQIPKDVKANKKELKGFNWERHINDVNFVNSVISDPNIINPQAHTKDMKVRFKPTPGMTLEQINNMSKREYANDPINIAQQNKDRLTTLMKDYKVNNINDLMAKMADKTERTAFIGNNYQFEVTNTAPAMKILHQRFNSRSATGGTGVYEINSDGSQKGSPISIDAVNSLFANNEKDNSVITLVHDTDNDRVVLVKNGKQYYVDANTIDPSGDLQVKLNIGKSLNARMANETNTDRFDELAEKYKTNAITLNTMMGRLLNTIDKTQAQ